MPKIECPQCQATTGLRGERAGDEIRITCGSCGHVWVRSPDRCPRCGHSPMVAARRPMYQKARGTQQSIVAYRIVRECTECGATSESEA